MRRTIHGIIDKDTTLPVSRVIITTPFTATQTDIENVKHRSLVAVWDTGANISCVRPDIIKALALPAHPTQYKMRNTAPFSQYQCHIIIPECHAMWLNIDILPVPTNSTCQVLIAMDIISQGCLQMQNGVFTFQFPETKNCRFF